MKRIIAFLLSCTVCALVILQLTSVTGNPSYSEMERVSPLAQGDEQAPAIGERALDPDGVLAPGYEASLTDVTTGKTAITLCPQTYTYFRLTPDADEVVRIETTGDCVTAGFLYGYPGQSLVASSTLGGLARNFAMQATLEADKTYVLAVYCENAQPVGHPALDIRPLMDKATGGRLTLAKTADVVQVSVPRDMSAGDVYVQCEEEEGKTWRYVPQGSTLLVDRNVPLQLQVAWAKQDAKFAYWRLDNARGSGTRDIALRLVPAQDCVVTPVFEPFSFSFEPRMLSNDAGSVTLVWSAPFAEEASRFRVQHYVITCASYTPSGEWIATKQLPPLSPTSYFYTDLVASGAQDCVYQYTVTPRFYDQVTGEAFLPTPGEPMSLYVGIPRLILQAQHNPSQIGEVLLEWMPEYPFYTGKDPTGEDATRYVLLRGTGMEDMKEIGSCTGQSTIDVVPDLGKTYYYCIAPENQGQYSSVRTSDIVSVAMERPALELSACSWNPFGVLLAWNKIPGVVRTDVYRAKAGEEYVNLTTPLGKGAQAAMDLEPCYIETNLDPSSSYLYYVEVQYADKQAPLRSKVLRVEPQLSVTGFAATPQRDCTVSLTWDHILGATRYEIYRKAQGDWSLLATCEQDDTTTQMVHVDATAKDGEAYAYKLVPYARGGDAEMEGQAAVAEHVRAAWVPLALTAQSSGYGSVRLTWQDAWTGKGYIIQRLRRATDKDAVDTVVITDPRQTEYLYEGLRQDVIAHFRICVYMEGEPDAPKNLGRFSPIASERVHWAAPTLTASLQQYQLVELSWPSVPGAKRYILERSTDGSSGFVPVDVSYATLADGVYTLTDGQAQAEGGSTFYYRLYAGASETARGGALLSPASNVASVRMGYAALELTAEGVGQGSIRLTWTGKDDVPGYLLQRATYRDGLFEDVPAILAAETNTYVDTGLTPGKTYYYRIAPSKPGVSGNNATFSKTASALATFPAATVSAKLMGQREVTVRWAPIEGAQAYLLERSTTSTYTDFAPLCTLTDGEALTYTDTHLEWGKDHTYRVRAFSMEGEAGLQSPMYGLSTGKVTVETGWRPVEPIVTAQAPRAVSLAWTAVPGATWYAVERTTDEDALGFEQMATMVQPALSGATVRYTDRTVEPGMMYYYRIQPVADQTVRGAYSDTCVAKTSLDTPQITLEPLDEWRVRIDWKPIPGADGYTLYYSDTETGNYQRECVLKTEEGAAAFAETAMFPGVVEVTPEGYRYVGTSFGAGTPTYFRISAYYLEGEKRIEGALSAAKRVTTLPVPPVAIEVLRSLTTNTLRWDRGTLAYAPEDMIEIYCAYGTSTQYVKVAQVPGDRNQYIHYAVLPNLYAKYRVRVCGQSLDGAQSFFSGFAEARPVTAFAIHATSAELQQATRDTDHIRPVVRKQLPVESQTASGRQ